MATTTINIGEKGLVQREIKDSAGTAVLFANLVALTCKLENEAGTDEVTFTMGGSPDIVVGDTTSEAEFEVTDTHSDAFTNGDNIYAVWTVTVTNTAFSSNQQIIIIKEHLYRVRTGG